MTATIDGVRLLFEKAKGHFHHSTGDIYHWKRQQSRKLKSIRVGRSNKLQTGSYESLYVGAQKELANLSTVS